MRDQKPSPLPNPPSPPLFVGAGSRLKRFMTRSRPLHAKHRLRRDEKLDLLDSFKSPGCSFLRHTSSSLPVP
ncbi:uncharacterized [Tachysurus ichikawai]